MATQKELEQVEAWSTEVEGKKRWIIVPMPIPSLKNKRKEFIKAVLDSRVKLIHDDWTECAADARTLSDTGGIYRVMVFSVRPAVITILAEFQNGRSVGK